LLDVVSEGRRFHRTAPDSTEFSKVSLVSSFIFVAYPLSPKEGAGTTSNGLALLVENTQENTNTRGTMDSSSEEGSKMDSNDAGKNLSEWYVTSGLDLFFLSVQYYADKYVMVVPLG
jgi:hypothetical protein